jgi:hypothetical protein
MTRPPSEAIEPRPALGSAWNARTSFTNCLATCMGRSSGLRAMRSKSHHRDRLLIPVEVRPHVGAARCTPRRHDLKMPRLALRQSKQGGEVLWAISVLDVQHFYWQITQRRLRSIGLGA